MSTSSKPLILYDLPSKPPCKAWSLNPWKTRMTLNYLSIPYTTEWIEYPDIAPRLKALNVTPNDSSHNPMPYSIPTVIFPSGSVVMDSKSIAVRLSKDHPAPPLHLDSPELAKVEKLIAKIQPDLKGVWLPPLPGKLLNEGSAEYMIRTRQERFGKTLEELRTQEGGEEAWLAALPDLKALADVVSAKGGPYTLGKEPSYVDFVVVSWLHFLNTIDEEIYKKVVAIDHVFGKLYDACGKWLERDDH